MKPVTQLALSCDPRKSKSLHDFFGGYFTGHTVLGTFWTGCSLYQNSRHENVRYHKRRARDQQTQWSLTTTRLLPSIGRLR